MSLFYDDLDNALLELIGIAGQNFTWNNQYYACVVNAEANSLTTSKTLFATSGFPMPGDIINLANKDRQVQSISNAASEYVAGGLASDNMFVDDPQNPSLTITFNSFIGK